MTERTCTIGHSLCFNLVVTICEATLIYTHTHLQRRACAYGVCVCCPNLNLSHSLVHITPYNSFIHLIVTFLHESGVKHSIQIFM